ncbi:MAG TPA: dihydropteroate synthase [Deltaproteobacteria bacterium]|nr:dihydropteroate synthase [Deltaproteobacteria bacterium]
MFQQGRPIYTLKCGDRTLELGKRTLIMGVLNVTPDSFSDGGMFFSTDRALEQAEQMVEAGADIIDIGGESTRPFSEPVEEDEEKRRVIPIIEKLTTEVPIPISIDTCKSGVAREALAAGATIINDVSALRFDPDLAKVAAENNVPVILMHMLGTPKTMQQKPHYDAVIAEIISFLQQRIEYATGQGIKREQIVVDPGIGFGKTVQHNLQILKHLSMFHALNCPLLLGASRKSFIGAVLDKENPLDREIGTGAVTCAAVLAGAHIIRVHDVYHNAEVTKMADAILAADNN